MNPKLIGLMGAAAVAALLTTVFKWPQTSVLAQSGTRGAAPARGNPGYGGNPASGARQSPSQPSQQSFEEQLWNWLQRVQYQHWAPLPGQPAEAFPGQEPHGAMVKVYANRLAAGNPKTLPHGSILVKENYGPDGKTLMAVTTMYRYPNYNPEHGDWHWAKYEPNGQVSRMNNMAVAGKVRMCIDCHSSAIGNDYCFANDR